MQPCENRPHADPWNAFEPLIAHEVRRWQGLVDADYCQDLRQIARLATWRAVNTYDDRRGTALSTYVYYCVERAVIDGVRAYRHHHRDTLVLDENREIAGAPPCDAGDDGLRPGEWSEHRFSNCLSREPLCHAFQRLNALERQIIAWYYGGQETDLQIAARLQISSEAAKKKRQRAIRRMNNDILRARFCPSTDDRRTCNNLQPGAV